MSELIIKFKAPKNRSGNALIDYLDYMCISLWSLYEDFGGRVCYCVTESGRKARSSEFNIDTEYSYSELEELAKQRQIEEFKRLLQHVFGKEIDKLTFESKEDMLRLFQIALNQDIGEFTYRQLVNSATFLFSDGYFTETANYECTQACDLTDYDYDTSGSSELALVLVEIYD